jgi:hypothetical protein
VAAIADAHLIAGRAMTHHNQHRDFLPTPQAANAAPLHGVGKAASARSFRSAKFNDAKSDEFACQFENVIITRRLPMSRRTPMPTAPELEQFKYLEEIIDAKQAAKEEGVSVATFLRRVAAGQLKRIQLSKRRFGYKRRHLLESQEARAVPVQPKAVRSKGPSVVPVVQP